MRYIPPGVSDVQLYGAYQATIHDPDPDYYRWGASLPDSVHTWGSECLLAFDVAPSCTQQPCCKEVEVCFAGTLHTGICSLLGSSHLPICTQLPLNNCKVGHAALLLLMQITPCSAFQESHAVSVLIVDSCFVLQVVLVHRTDCRTMDSRSFLGACTMSTTSTPGSMLSRNRLYTLLLPNQRSLPCQCSDTC